MEKEEGEWEGERRRERLTWQQCNHSRWRCCGGRRWFAARNSSSSSLCRDTSLCFSLLLVCFCLLLSFFSFSFFMLLFPFSVLSCFSSLSFLLSFSLVLFSLWCPFGFFAPPPLPPGEGVFIGARGSGATLPLSNHKDRVGWLRRPLYNRPKAASKAWLSYPFHDGGRPWGV